MIYRQPHAQPLECNHGKGVSFTLYAGDPGRIYRNSRILSEDEVRPFMTEPDWPA